MCWMWWSGLRSSCRGQTSRWRSSGEWQGEEELRRSSTQQVSRQARCDPSICAWTPPGGAGARTHAAPSPCQLPPGSRRLVRARPSHVPQILLGQLPGGLRPVPPRGGSLRGCQLPAGRPQLRAADQEALWGGVPRQPRAAPAAHWGPGGARAGAGCCGRCRRRRGCRCCGCMAGPRLAASLPAPSASPALSARPPARRTSSQRRRRCGRRCWRAGAPCCARTTALSRRQTQQRRGQLRRGRARGRRQRERSAAVPPRRRLLPRCPGRSAGSCCCGSSQTLTTSGCRMPAWRLSMLWPGCSRCCSPGRRLAQSRAQSREQRQRTPRLPARKPQRRSLRRRQATRPSQQGMQHQHHQQQVRLGQGVQSRQSQQPLRKQQQARQPQAQKRQKRQLHSWRLLGQQNQQQHQQQRLPLPCRDCEDCLFEAEQCLSWVA